MQQYRSIGQHRHAWFRGPSLHLCLPRGGVRVDLRILHIHLLLYVNLACRYDCPRGAEGGKYFTVRSSAGLIYFPRTLSTRRFKNTPQVSTLPLIPGFAVLALSRVQCLTALRGCLRKSVSACALCICASVWPPPQNRGTRQSEATRHEPRLRSLATRRTSRADPARRVCCISPPPHCHRHHHHHQQPARLAPPLPTYSM